MKITNTLKTVTIAMLLSSSVWAGTDSQKNTQTEMPMMTEGSNSSMKEHKKHHEKPMTEEGSQGKTMDPHMKQMMKMMMGHRQHHNMSTMEGGKGGKMMDPAMMQQSKQHMSGMEQRLANIEALLEKLVELQKP